MVQVIHQDAIYDPPGERERRAEGERKRVSVTLLTSRTGWPIQKTLLTHPYPKANRRVPEADTMAFIPKKFCYPGDSKAQDKEIRRRGDKEVRRKGDEEVTRSRVKEEER